MSSTLERNAEDKAEESHRRAVRAGNKLNESVDAASDAVEASADEASSTLGDLRDKTRSAVKAGAEQLSELAATGRETVGSTAQYARESYDDIVERLDQAYHDGFAEGGRAIQRSADTAGRLAREHPLVLCALGVAGGLLLGALLPRSRTEERLIGPYAERVSERAQSYGKKAVREGRKRVERAAREVSDKA